MTLTRLGAKTTWVSGLVRLAQSGIPGNSVPAKWVVYSKHCLVKTETVLAYLGRYVRKIAISESRIEQIGTGSVRFRYLDYRDNRPKSMTLTGVEFLRRFLGHVLPKGFVRVRHYGFLANCCRKKKVKLIREYKAQAASTKPEDNGTNTGATDTVPIWLCPQCRKGHMQRYGVEARAFNPLAGSGLNINEVNIVKLTR